MALGVRGARRARGSGAHRDRDAGSAGGGVVRDLRAFDQRAIASQVSSDSSVRLARSTFMPMWVS